MQPLSGPGTPIAGERPPSPGKTAATDDQPLSPAQRTTLEKLIVKIMTLSPVKSAEIWASLRHDLGADKGGELLARHFQPAEQLLQTRLTQAQQNHAGRQLLQQLAELLPQGNNRQAVSDFIRQRFGHTVLSQLSPPQLQQVLNLLQTGGLTIPQPQQTATSDRPLLPAEHQSLQQQVTKLSAATGEAPAKIWQTLFDLAGVKTNDPLPARHFQLLNQFLQVKVALSPQNAPTLNNLLAALKQPADEQELQQMNDYCQTRFNCGANAPLTHPQMSDAIHQLFARRLEKAGQAQPIASPPVEPQPLLNPLIAALPLPLQKALSKPAVALILLLLTLAVVLALVF
ncbi:MULTISPECIES: flagella biosynthesis regulator Flk [Serratia]|uniref:flagella biosynthesis regulator Flk n=1 Tax=Serratia TaxID=613 RepID=UPI0006BC95E0|nr:MULTISPECIES: flagella biosynthesis regulator Flk [Serratia]ALD45929.1 flagella biosynthesis regulator [Serratia marcescens]ASM13096.1 flagella biosynthesis regulator [Serratia marcescens]MBH2945672.1 flagella biosynthesis regulator Flk [Serratia ureilytica]MBN5358945.1 flagella biosynthesis regulator Flk [Serratia ureilytica]NMU42055.1 flagella biosynthesis regulator Flk [Serratia marcescens]